MENIKKTVSLTGRMMFGRSEQHLRRWRCWPANRCESSWSSTGTRSTTDVTSAGNRSSWRRKIGLVNLEYLRQQRQLEGAAQTQKAADLIQAIDELQELVRTTSFKATTVESRIKRTQSFLIGGIAAAGLLGALILLAALWSSSNLKTVARAKADILQTLYVDQIEAARLEGDAELAALQSEISTRRSDIERQNIEVGAGLSEIADERDATRLALEELVDLRNRIGLELVEDRGRVIFVVPDGSELLAWRAPDLSKIASYNGRMYRLSQCCENVALWRNFSIFTLKRKSSRYTLWRKWSA